MNNFLKFFSSVLIAFSLAGFLSTAQAEIVQVFGDDGQFGDDGTDGLPGNRGGDGESVVAAASGEIDPEYTIGNATAGDGGSGGRGGIGVFDNPDGGDGGDGGNGGNAFARVFGATTGEISNVGVRAYGGDGGDGGQGGSGVLGGMHGNSGDGGDGGNAHSLLKISAFDNAGINPSDIVLRSIGGWGGVAYRGAASAGTGGNAFGAAHVELESENNLSTRLDLEIRGGDGGRGYDGANAGNGGQAVIGPVSVSAGRQSPLEVLISVTGGFGGDASGSIAHASGDGGSGAAVSLRNQAVFTGRYIDLTQRARGGTAGEAGAGELGQAGSAYSEFIHDDSEIEGSLRLATSATGGAGGDRRHSSSPAGDGADAEAQTNLTSSRQSAQASAFAISGGGGTGRGGANGGAAGNALAESVLFFNADSPSSAGSSNATARGGDAGDAQNGSNRQGQNGGNAVANATATGTGLSNIAASASASAGAGGSTTQVNSGMGGNGGDAQATSIAQGESSVTAYASAFGARGGRGVGNNFRGGTGSVGTAIATAVSSGDGDVLSWVTNSAGSGGIGEDGADSGDGADVILDNAATGTTAGSLTLRQTASGGGGGGVFGSGSAGRAGSATTRSDVVHTGTDVAVVDTVSAGSGGTNFDDGQASGGGVASASAHVLSFGDASLALNIYGGAGGNARSMQAAGNGGDAVLGEAVVRATGDAQIEVTLWSGINGRSTSGDDGSAGAIEINGPVYAESTSGGLVDVKIVAWGSGAWEGGFAQDVILIDEADGYTSGSMVLDQAAIAGGSNVYNDTQSNHAANAVASLTRAAHLQSLEIYNHATAGGGAGSVSGSVGHTGVGGNGGNADAISVAQNSGGEARSNAQAGGGTGGEGYVAGGAGGAGNARAVAHSLAPGFSSSAISGAYSGDAGASSAGEEAVGTNGTDVTSYASATSSGFGSATSTSSGRGGAGSGGLFLNPLGVGGNGGESRSTANALAEDGLATARAIAIGGSGGEDAIQTGLNGTARSLATAESHFSATAIAESESGSLFNAPTDLGRTISTADAIAQNASASAQSVSQASALVREVRSTADSANNGHALARTVAAGGMIEAGDLYTEFQGATAIAVGLPDAAQITQLLSDFTNVADNFDVAGDSDVLAFVNMGVGFDSATASNQIAMSSGVSLEVTTAELDNSQNLLFGLLDFRTDTDGMVDFTFHIDVSNTTVFDMAFTSVLEVESFFTDNTLDLGVISELVTPNGVLDIDVSIFSNTPLAQAGFIFRGILGNSTIDIAAVPLPAGVWLLLSACGVLFFRRC